MKTILDTIIVLIGIPAIIINLFITHELLEFIDADRLLWFLYWSYVPMVIVTGMVQSILVKFSQEKDD